jgi:hypothetical protein
MLGIDWSGLPEHPPRPRFVVGRAHTDAWLVAARPDYDEGDFHAVIGWDEQRIDPLGCSLLMRSELDGLPVLTRHVKTPIFRRTLRRRPNHAVSPGGTERSTCVCPLVRGVPSGASRCSPLQAGCSISDLSWLATRGYRLQAFLRSYLLHARAANVIAFLERLHRPVRAQTSQMSQRSRAAVGAAPAIDVRVLHAGLTSCTTAYGYWAIPALLVGTSIGSVLARPDSRPAKTTTLTELPDADGAHWRDQFEKWWHVAR